MHLPTTNSVLGVCLLVRRRRLRRLTSLLYKVWIIMEFIIKPNKMSISLAQTRAKFHNTFFVIIYAAIGILQYVLTEVIPLGTEITAKKVLLNWLQNTWGLYYKTFYGSNCCRIVISWGVCHFLSLPPWPNICRQD